jgi:hypothetical protein
MKMISKCLTRIQTKVARDSGTRRIEEILTGMMKIIHKTETAMNLIMIAKARIANTMTRLENGIITNMIMAGSKTANMEITVMIAAILLAVIPTAMKERAIVILKMIGMITIAGVTVVRAIVSRINTGVIQDRTRI